MAKRAGDYDKVKAWEAILSNGARIPFETLSDITDDDVFDPLPLIENRDIVVDQSYCVGRLSEPGIITLSPEAITSMPTNSPNGVRTRFAPSPTGDLHLGHAYSAKVAHDLARESGGRFLLRHEDIDGGRVKPEFYRHIEEDLEWLGLRWDGEILIQSGRREAFDDVLEKLKKMGLAYPCFCSRKDIQAALSAPHGSDTAIYPGTCRTLSGGEIHDRIVKGYAHAWRFHAEKAARTPYPQGQARPALGRCGYSIRPLPCHYCCSIRPAPRCHGYISR
jgi:hypothetical protein